MSTSKEALIHKWRTARHIFAASLLGVSAITAGGAEAGSRFDRILQEVPTPVVVPEETVEEVEQEEQAPESGIQATIPPTPVVLVMPTPSAEVAALFERNDWPNYAEHVEDVREAQQALVASLPEFNPEGYQTFTYDGRQIPFGSVDARDVNIYLQSEEQLSLSTHFVAVTAVERQTFQWPEHPNYVVEYVFVVFQYENATFVVSYGPYQPGLSGQSGLTIENLKVSRDGAPSQTSPLRVNIVGLEARYQQAMRDREQVMIQFFNSLRLAGYQNRDEMGRAYEELQTTANGLLIEAIRDGVDDSPSAGVENPETVTFLHQ